MNILIVGYPYVRENYLRTFDFYPETDGVFFVLPRAWKVKSSKFIYYPPHRKVIYTTPIFFSHSGYPIIGGLLKGFMPLFPFQLFKIKKDKRIDLVYNCNEPTLLTAVYNSIWIKVFGLKNVLFSWENISFNSKFKGIKGLIHRLILKVNLSLADGVICGNKKCLEIFTGLTHKPLAEIPLSGLDEDFFKPESSNVRDSNVVIFSFVGSISYRKGIHIILEAFKKMSVTMPNIELVIVGSGEFDEGIDNQINCPELIERVKRIPWTDQKELLDIFRSSDVFLYPSIEYKGWQEQFGYSMAEASLCELPVIATHSGSIDEVVVDGKTGLLVNENDVGDLKKAMEQLARNQELREAMGRAGREYIVKNFSHKTIANKFYIFFNTI